MCVQPPSNGVELNVSPADLAIGVDLEQIESFDFILASTHAREGPVPYNFVAADNDVVGLDVSIWVSEDAGKPLGLGGCCETAELRVNQH